MRSLKSGAGQRSLHGLWSANHLQHPWPEPSLCKEPGDGGGGGKTVGWGGQRTEARWSLNAEPGDPAGSFLPMCSGHHSPSDAQLGMGISPPILLQSKSCLF